MNNDELKHWEQKYDEEIKALKDENKRLKETIKKIEKENIGLRLSLASYELM